MVAIGIKANKSYNYVEIESSSVITAFARSNTENYINNADNENRILWMDNKKSQELMNNPKVQFPSTIHGSDLDLNLASFKEKIKSK